MTSRSSSSRLAALSLLLSPDTHRCLDEAVEARADAEEYAGDQEPRSGVKLFVRPPAEKEHQDHRGGELNPRADDRPDAPEGFAIVRETRIPFLPIRVFHGKATSDRAAGDPASPRSSSAGASPLSPT